LQYLQVCKGCEPFTAPYKHCTGKNLRGSAEARSAKPAEARSAKLSRSNSELRVCAKLYGDGRVSAVSMNFGAGNKGALCKCMILVVMLTHNMCGSSRDHTLEFYDGHQTFATESVQVNMLRNCASQMTIKSCMRLTANESALLTERRAGAGPLETEPHEVKRIPSPDRSY